MLLPNLARDAKLSPRSEISATRSRSMLLKAPRRRERGNVSCTNRDGGKEGRYWNVSHETKLKKKNLATEMASRSSLARRRTTPPRLQLPVGSLASDAVATSPALEAGREAGAEAAALPDDSVVRGSERSRCAMALFPGQACMLIPLPLLTWRRCCRAA